MNASGDTRKQLAEMFIRDITERPNDFTHDGYCLTDNASGREWWVGNEAWAFGLYRPYKITIGKLGMFNGAGRRCFRAYEQWLVSRLDLVKKADKRVLTLVPRT